MARSIDLLLELSQVTPHVWRTLRVPTSLGLDDLHHAIQVVMGWNDFHPHLFEVGEAEYGPAPDRDEDEDDEPVREATAWAGEDRDLTIQQALKLSPSGIVYVYDFAEDWRVRITLVGESESEGGREVLCLDGENAGPQQDSLMREPFNVETVNRLLATARRPSATPEQPAGPGASPDQQLLAQLTLAVLMLGSRPARHGRPQAWKHLRPEVLESLHEAGLIELDPQRKAVTLTDRGVVEARRLLQKITR